MLKLRSISCVVRLSFASFAPFAPLAAVAALASTACASGTAPEAAGDATAAIEAVDPTPTPPGPTPHLENQQFVLYYSARAVEEVVLKKDASYLAVDGITTASGTWAYDASTGTLTLTPTEGSNGSSAPPPFRVIAEQCDHGWFTAIVRGTDRFIPYGIDPEFERQYCHVITTG